MNAYRFASRRWPALFAVVALLAGAGIYIALGLPLAIFPSVTFPIVKVIADAGEEPAARMMPTVTRPLEEAMHRVPGVELVRSITSRGSTPSRTSGPIQFVPVPPSGLPWMGTIIRVTLSAQCTPIRSPPRATSARPSPAWR